MVLDKHRSRLDWWLVPLAKAFRRVHPNVLTWLTLPVALAGGAAFWQSGPDRIWLLALAAILVALSGILDVLDGKIATITDRATPKGDYLDHAMDRFADTAFILGIAFSPWARIEVGAIALAAVLLTSYLGTQAQAVGIGRNYAGVLGRADRLILLMLVPGVQFGLAAGGVAWPEGLARWTPSLLDALLLYFAILGLVSTVQRFWKGLRGFDADGRLR